MQIIHDYRALHAIPELDRTLPKTMHYIRSVLQPLKCAVFSPAEGALCGFFDYGKSKTIAFRADMDALPIQEETSLPWASRHPGRMHACGHDGHTAILLELARRLNREKAFAHNILLIFQPAEETDGGAEDICKSGIFQKYGVKEIYGLHLWPGLKKGQLFSRPGVLMSRASEIMAAFYGKSVHIANHKKGGDGICACLQFYRMANKLQRDFPFLLKFGRISGGTAGNVICDSAVLWGSVRTFHEEHHRQLQQSLHILAKNAADQTGCRASVSFSQGYPMVCNDRALWEKMQKKCPVSKLNGAFWTTDDFSYYQREIPGIYFLLGVGNTPPLHSSQFAFDEKILINGADFFDNICKTP